MAKTKKNGYKLDTKKKKLLKKLTEQVKYCHNLSLDYKKKHNEIRRLVIYLKKILEKTPEKRIGDTDILSILGNLPNIEEAKLKQNKQDLINKIQIQKMWKDDVNKRIIPDIESKLGIKINTPDIHSRNNIKTKKNNSDNSLIIKTKKNNNNYISIMNKTKKIAKKIYDLFPSKDKIKKGLDKGFDILPFTVKQEILRRKLEKGEEKFEKLTNRLILEIDKADDAIRKAELKEKDKKEKQSDLKFIKDKLKKIDSKNKEIEEKIKKTKDEAYLVTLAAARAEQTDLLRMILDNLKSLTQ